MSDLKISGVRRLGEALGISKTVAAEIARQAWFPPKAPDGTWSTAEVRKAYADYKSGVLSTKAPDPVAIGEIVSDVDLRRVLATSKSPEELGLATVQLVARSIAGAQEIGVKHVIAMKSAQEELRKGVAAYMKIAKERGDLIDRDVAKSIAGQLAAKANATCDIAAVRLGSKFEEWWADPEMDAKTSEDRKRIVRSWLEAQFNALRLIEVDEVERMVQAEVRERESD